MISILQDSKQNNDDILYIYIQYEALTNTVLFCYGCPFPDGMK